MIVIDLWCDGSGTIAGQPGGWAYVLHAVHPVTGEEKIVEGSGGAPDATNNRMELTALLEGLRAIKRPSTVVVHADSEYVINPLRHGWIEKWERTNYAKKKNADIWRELVVEVRKHSVTYEHVKGHSGVHYNERCDVLAGQERRRLLEDQAIVD
jgi:ribonuclease HI